MPVSLPQRVFRSETCTVRQEIEDCAFCANRVIIVREVWQDLRDRLVLGELPFVNKDPSSGCRETLGQGSNMIESVFIGGNPVGDIAISVASVMDLA